MPTGNFATQFAFFKLRNDGQWFDALPAISAEYKKSAVDLSGTYKISYPNPAGLALNYFTHFDNQELWFAHVPSSSMYRVMAGQISGIEPTGRLTMDLHGRGLTSILTDRKVSGSWASKRGDFILCDPTFGVIPTEHPELTTWNAFTDDFDRFDYWNSTRWGAQPAWADVIDGVLELTGSGSATRTLTGTDAYNFETMEFRVKVGAASNTVRFGLTDATRTNYVLFELAAGAVNCKNSNGLGSQSTATTTSITQTAYNYYRLEWAPGSARFLVNGVLEVTTALNVPVATLYPFFELDNTTQVLTADHMKAIAITTLFATYVANDEIEMDVVRDITSVGNSNTDFTFYVDDDWDFNAHPKKSTASGFSYGYGSSVYTGAAQKVAGIKLNYEAKDLYNSVKIRGGNMLHTVAAPNWTDQFTGDGTQTAFTLGYQAKKPLTLLQVNGVTKTEGTDFSVTYGKEHTVVQFAAAPANGHSVNVRYDYYTPIIATATNDPSIAAYGITREYSKNDENITSQDRASNLANALLLYYSDPRTVITITIPLDPRPQVGTTVNADAPYYGITNTAYEIIEIEGKMAAGVWETKLTLASTEINTTGEIVREILQQLKALKNRGDTSTLTLDETKLVETTGLAQLQESYITYVCDSFILGHNPNGVLGRGAVLEEWEAGVGSWTGAGCALSSDATTYRVGTKSLKLVASVSPFTATTTQSFGNLQTYAGVASGTPTGGTLGVWVYCTAGTEISGVTLRVGSSASDYTEVAGVKPGTAAPALIAGWNYFVFRLANGATTGTPDWTAADYARLSFTSSSTPTIYADYFTIGTGNIIALNGLGRRVETPAGYATVPAT